MVTQFSPSIKKTSERINPNGDIVNPKTKEIIQKNEQDFIPETPLQVTESPVIVQSSERTLKVIKAEILATEAKLASLNEEKKVKVEEMLKELED